MTILMKCLLLFLIFLNRCFAQTTFSNPNYPKLIENVNSFSQTYQPSAGKNSVALLFREFQLEKDDCILMRLTSNLNKVDGLCGDVLGDPTQRKGLVMPGAASVSTFNGNRTDNMYHSGVLADVVSLDASMSYFTCGSTIDLSTLQDSHFILASQNYPSEPTSYAEGCSISFTNKDNNIRFAIYSLGVEPNKDSFSITANDGTTEQFSNYSITNPSATVRYYPKQVTARFTFASQPINSQRGFYILVNGYNESIPVDGNCAGAIVNGLYGPKTIYANETLTSFAIGQQTYLGGRVYDNNVYCNFDYTKAVKDFWFFVDLRFSSESCCDYMEVNGLLPTKTTFQGFLGHNYYFSKADRITMNFLADAVGPAPGFFGSIQTIDCTQCGGVLNFGVNMNSASVMSPNYMQSFMPYCPNLNCKWTINIDYGYYVNFIYRGVTLSQPDNNNDTLIITDRFGSVIRNYISGGPVDLTESNLITGPITIEFKSSTQTQFAFDKLGKGFNIDMTSSRQQYMPNNITLTDNQYFVDLSQNNFNSVGVTYSYLVQARSGKKVSLFFMTSIEDQAFVTIYDGATTDAQMIDTSSVVNTNFHNYVLKAPRLTSTGQFMLIHIRPGTDREPGRYTQDFQAIVSDYEPPAGCAYLVQSVNPQSGSVSAVIFEISKGQNCQMIIHATDTTNAALLATQFQFIIVEGQFSLYKGLTTDETHKLRTDVDPILVFDRNTVIQYTANVTFTYSWYHARQYDLPIQVNPGVTGSLMTQDYIPYGQKMTDNMQQSFIISPMGNTKSITLSIQRPIGAATVQIQTQTPERLYTYTSANIGERIAFNCSRLYLNYSSPIGQNNGFYATYEAVYNPSPSTKSANYFSIFTIFTIVVSLFL